ncbi:helix-turn-helix domain-containing protein [Oligoflexia bacterium]|nr:helix-turn-helix domain-containing protein [Oligoflexia bacterium]
MNNDRYRVIIERAKQREAVQCKRRAEPAYQCAMAWLGYTGLLRHNRIPACRTDISIEDLLAAAELEPRVLELLPAILTQLRDMLLYRMEDLPSNLRRVVQALLAKKEPPNLGGLEAQQYMQWLDAPAMRQALKRLHPRAKPRQRQSEVRGVAQQISSARRERGFTQLHLSRHFQISLRALRDLEQGSVSPSLGRVIEIADTLGLKVALVPNS